MSRTTKPSGSCFAVWQGDCNASVAPDASGDGMVVCVKAGDDETCVRLPYSDALRLSAAIQERVAYAAKRNKKASKP